MNEEEKAATPGKEYMDLCFANNNGGYTITPIGMAMLVENFIGNIQAVEKRLDMIEERVYD
jgi:hypothetical protein